MSIASRANYTCRSDSSAGFSSKTLEVFVIGTWGSSWSSSANTLAAHFLAPPPSSSLLFSPLSSALAARSVYSLRSITQRTRPDANTMPFPLHSTPLHSVSLLLLPPLSAGINLFSILVSSVLSLQSDSRLRTVRLKGTSLSRNFRVHCNFVTSGGGDERGGFVRSMEEECRAEEPSS